MHFDECADDDYEASDGGESEEVEEEDTPLTERDPRVNEDPRYYVKQEFNAQQCRGERDLRRGRPTARGATDVTVNLVGNDPIPSRRVEEEVAEESYSYLPSFRRVVGQVSSAPYLNVQGNGRPIYSARTITLGRSSSQCASMVDGRVGGVSGITVPQLLHRSLALDNMVETNPLFSKNTSTRILRNHDIDSYSRKCKSLSLNADEPYLANVTCGRGYSHVTGSTSHVATNAFFLRQSDSCLTKTSAEYWDLLLATDEL